MYHLSTQAHSAAPALSTRRLIIYASTGDKGSRWLGSISSLEAEGFVTEIHRKTDSFFRSLNRVLTSKAIAVFITENPADINALTAVREQMSSVKSILVYPAHSDKSAVSALFFYPRFTACIEDSPAQACAVLKKMIA